MSLQAGLSNRVVWGRSPAEIVGSNPTGGMDVVFRECHVLSGSLCDKLIARPEESYQLWCVMCDPETSRMRRPWPMLGCSITGKKKSHYSSLLHHTNFQTLISLCKIWGSHKRVSEESQVFWDLMLCCWVNGSLTFWRTVSHIKNVNHFDTFRWESCDLGKQLTLISSMLICTNQYQ